jgi:RHH-type rel operon transcriptional repressor/antitoxin RelB
MISMRLTPELEARLDALVKRTGRTKTYYIREAITEHIDELEDVYLADQRVADLRAGRSDLISFEEMAARYGLDD